MDDLKLEAKCRFKEIYDLLSDGEKYCDGCVFLHLEPPFKGITTSDINVWRDGYKAKCEQFDMIRACYRNNKIPRFFECIVMDGKYVN